MTISEDSILVTKIKENFGDAVVETTVIRGEVTHVVKKDSLLDIFRFLKSERDLRMNYFVDVVGVDCQPTVPRFEVVYHLYSIPNKLRIRLKVRIGENESVPSATALWKGANWPEREAFDMFGIVFEGHPDLRRIYLAENWKGFPLRKDYPLKGFKDEYNPYGEEEKD